MAEKPESAAPPAPPAKEGSPAKVVLAASLGSVVLAVGLTFALAEFVLLPRVQAKGGGAHAEAGHAEEAVAHDYVPTPDPGAAKPAGGGHGGGAAAEVDNRTYAFNNVVVNLSDTMGGRYLKVSFTVTGQRQDVAPLLQNRHIEALDATINVLSSLTLADLEEAGAKNLIRTRLVTTLNEIFKARVVEQIYFSEFVVQ